MGNKDIMLQARPSQKRPNFGARGTHVRQSSSPAGVHTFTSLDMDYLRTLGTAAVSSIVQKSGLNLPFSLGAKFPPLDALNVWTLYNATKRVFTLSSNPCDCTDSGPG